MAHDCKFSVDATEAWLIERLRFGSRADMDSQSQKLFYPPLEGGKRVHDFREFSSGESRSVQIKDGRFSLLQGKKQGTGKTCQRCLCSGTAGVPPAVDGKAE